MEKQEQERRVPRWMSDDGTCSAVLGANGDLHILQRPTKEHLWNSAVMLKADNFRATDYKLNLVGVSWIGGGLIDP